jgi:hypothetical protein
MDAPEREIPRAVVVVGSDERRGEATRRLLHARAAGAHEQVGVHRPLGRALEQRDRLVLADDAVPSRCGHAVILPATP